MRTKYPSGHRKSTPTVPITPFQLQNCSFIHHSTASLTDLLESTAETPHTPQICLQRPISGWIRPLSCVRNTLQATANRHQPLPQPVMLTERRIYGLTKGVEVVRQTNRVSKKGSRLARESFGESPRFFFAPNGTFPIWTQPVYLQNGIQRSDQYKKRRSRGKSDCYCIQCLNSVVTGSFVSKLRDSPQFSFIN